MKGIGKSIGIVSLWAASVVVGCSASEGALDNDKVGAERCESDCTTISTPPCLVGTCNGSTGRCEIVPAEDGSACDDGLFCTVEDTCAAGQCSGGIPNDCGLKVPPCTAVHCDEASRACSSSGEADGADCVPENLCEIGGKCQRGNCRGVLNDCFFAPVPNMCHVATCDPSNGQCRPTPGNSGLGCTDPDDLCTANKVCDDGGICAGGSSKDCSHLSVGCNDGACDSVTGQCHQVVIGDGMPCGAATDQCNRGICDKGSCDPVAINEGLSCDDGLSCTSGTSCNLGACVGGSSPVEVFLFDDFDTNLAGWQRDPEWEIGPARLSTGHSLGCGSADPALDHTATQDNGVAGVNIGGNAIMSVHDNYFLTSPVVDTSGASTLVFSFWRWLNSDYAPFMRNRVEVFDGAVWHAVYQTGGLPGVSDTVWNKVSVDISAHANAQMRVRFGFSISTAGAYICSGWNVDDVLIAAGSCN